MGVATVLLRAKYTQGPPPLLVDNVCTSIIQLSYANSTILAEVLDPPANQEVHLGKND